MKLQPIEPGDIIRWDDGLINFGKVSHKESGRVVAHLLRSGARYAVKASEITGHWRMSGETKVREGQV